MPLLENNINTLWASLLVEEWVRLGVSHAVVCPGSRSSPLVASVAAHPGIETTVHFDERGAAFFALGYGKATGGLVFGSLPPVRL